MVTGSEEESWERRRTDESHVTAYVGTKVAPRRGELSTPEGGNTRERPTQNGMNAGGRDLLAKPDVLHRGTTKDPPISAGHDVRACPEHDGPEARRSFVEQHHLTPHRSYGGQLGGDARDERGPTARREHGNVGAQLTLVERDSHTPTLFDEQPLDGGARTDGDTLVPRNCDHEGAQQGRRVYLCVLGEVGGSHNAGSQLGLDRASRGAIE